MEYTGDVMHIVGLIFIHMLCLFAPFNFSWVHFGGNYPVCGDRVVWGYLCYQYHRQLAHNSFKLHPTWLEYLYAYFAVHSTRCLLYWVGNHKFHHKFSDTDQDLHSPAEGFWFSHLTWMFNENYITQKCGKHNMEDLRKQWVYRLWRAHTYFMLFNLGLYCISLVDFLILYGAWFVNMFAFGEGWHNNHHAFEYSARHGHEWWQIDMTWYVIKLLEYIGVAIDEKLPSETRK